MSPYAILRNSALLASAIATIPAFAQVFYTGGTYGQNFDTLPTTTVTAAFSTTVGAQTAIPGLTTWAATKNAGTGSVGADMRVDAGTTASGYLYSYGVAASSERALGALASGSNAMSFGTEIVNDTGGTLSSVTISFTAEFWRSSTSAVNTLAFAYGISGGSITSANYLTSTAMSALTTLDVVGPAPVAANGALDGNLSANQSVVTATINGLAVPPGGSLYIRWADFNDGGNDAGLAIDNFSLSGVVATGGDISRGLGTTFTPTSFGGNPFTANDTAVFDGSASAVTVSGLVQAFGLKFTTDGYTVTGGLTDLLSVQTTTFVDSGVTATIAAILGGDDGLIKTGAGTLVLSGANTFTGAISVSAGRLTIGSDLTLGASDNDLTVNGTLQITSSNFTLGASRTLAGTGVIETSSGGSLSITGPIAAGALTVSGPSTLELSGATKTLATLVLPGSTAVNITGGALQPSAGITFGQSNGTSVVTGDIAFGASGDRAMPVSGGTVEIDGVITLGGRLIKTGAGTLDLTGGSLSGTTAANGGVRLGVQGGTPATGGTLRIDSSADLGNLQMHLNSGTLQVAQPVTTAVGVSFGGRRGSSVAPVVITGESFTFTGASSLFNATGAEGTLGFNIDNITTINGTIPVISAAGSVGWVEMGGSGTLIYGGNASALIDNYAVTDTLTFVLNGTFGGKQIAVDPNATLAGKGTFTGWVTTTTSTDTPPVVTTTYSSESVVIVSGTLAPTGLLTVNAGLSLSGTTVLDIAGSTRGTEYDSLALINPDASGAVSYVLAYGGALKLNFPASALNGSYTLFEIGATNVSRSGGFSSVALTGLYTVSLSPSGSVWSGTSSSVSFSFDESTGVLTITGAGSTLSPIEQWRLANFGISTNTGTAADSADFDGDGIANLIEYATGTEPDAYNVSAVVQGRSGDFLTLSYPKISDSSLTYTVQATSDLATAFATGTGSSNTSGGIATYTDDVSLSTAGVRRFLRLQVLRAE